MNDPLFKILKEPLAPEDEAEITRRLAEAYSQTEETLSEPAFERIQQKILEHFARIHQAPPPD